MPPKSTKSTEPSEADIIFTKASVALAKSQRLIASWLPAKTVEEIASENTRAQEDELEDVYKAGSELLGVGAEAPDSSEINILKRKDQSLDALRKQLLGRHAPKPGQMPSKPVPTGLTKTPARPVQDDSDSDEGRAAAFTSRGKGRKGNLLNVAVENADDELSTTTPAPVVLKPSKRKATSYLDEIMAEKSAKKKKKKRKGTTTDSTVTSS